MAHLRDARVGVIGGEAISPKPGAVITLADMKPGEMRWLGLTYTLASGAEGTMIPLGLSLMDRETVVNAVTFGIVPSPIAAVAHANLKLHETVFTRLATDFRIAEAKPSAAAALEHAKDEAAIEKRYLPFLAEQQRAVDAVFSRLVRGEKGGDPFGVAEAARELGRATASGHPAPAATAHRTLLEKLNSAQNMIDFAKGNPLAVLHMVQWQRELYATAPRLKGLPVAADVVKESDAFIEAFKTTKDGGRDYAALLAKLQKSFAATAKAGIDVGTELAAMQKAGRAVAPLQKAHREFLLKLDAAESAGSSKY
jgi:hypothetical protein